MKKFILVFLVLCTVALAGGYFYGRAHLPDVPGLAVGALKKQGIDLKFEGVELPRRGLSLTLKKVTLEGPTLPFQLSASRLMADLDLTLGWPVLHLGVALIDPIVQGNPDPKPAPTSPTPPANPTLMRTLSSALALVQAQLGITNLTFSDLGVRHLDFVVTLRRLSLDERGVSGAEFSHELLLGQDSQHPWLSGLHWKGDSSLLGGAIQSQDQSLAFGPFVLQVDGRFNLKDHKWTAEAILPKTRLGPGSAAVNAGATWLKSVTGDMEMKLSAQGLGTDPHAMNAEGKVIAHSLVMNVDHRTIRGETKAEMDLEFSKSQALSLRGNLFVDLTQTALSHADNFRKPRGVPCSLALSVDGKEGRFTFSQVEGKFNDLALSARGDINLGPDLQAKPKVDLKMALASTSLEGWEQFFPQYASVKTRGTMEGRVDYQGRLDDWKTAEIDATLKANDVRVPLSIAWIPGQDLRIEGVADLATDTALTYMSGALKRLSTVTRLDLSGAAINYGSAFQKPAKIPLTAEISVVSAGQSAEIRRGELVAGNLRAHLKGNVDRFKKPILNLSFETDSVPISEIVALSPTASPKGVSDLSGNLRVQGSVHGTLVSPELRAQISLQHFAGTYTPEEGHSTEIKDAGLDLDLQSCDRPNVRFALNGSKLVLSEHVEQSLSYLNGLPLDGKIAFEEVDFGGTKAAGVSATIAYDKRSLRVSSLRMHVLGGIVSGNTEWDGRGEVPKVKLALHVGGVDANGLLASLSETSKDLVFGTLKSDLNLEVAGLTAEEMKKSVVGGGGFSLSNGGVHTLKLAQAPLEALRRLPLVGPTLGQPKLDEKLSQMDGSFRLENGRVLFSNLAFHSPYMDAFAKEASVGFDENVRAKLEWSPKPALIPRRALEILRGPTGRANLPLTVSGPMSAPTLTLDQGVAEERAKAFALRKAGSGRNRAVNQLKSH